jgi:hypothetical protein
VGLALVLAIRLTVPLSIFRWPLAGGLLAIVADSIDIVIFQVLGFPSFLSYHQIDKALDAYYLVIEALVVQGWDPLPRWTATALFAYRMAGVAVFELTDARALLLLFPNLFEFFYLFYVAARRFAPSYELTPKRTAAWLGVLLVPKEFQEYALHYARWLDHAVAADIIHDDAIAVWDWLRDLVT